MVKSNYWITIHALGGEGDIIIKQKSIKAIIERDSVAEVFLDLLSDQLTSFNISLEESKRLKKKLFFGKDVINIPFVSVETSAKSEE